MACGVRRRLRDACGASVADSRSAYRNPSFGAVEIGVAADVVAVGGGVVGHWKMKNYEYEKKKIFSF